MKAKELKTGRTDPMTKWKLVPVEPTKEMLARYGNALRNHIKAVPKEQRAGRWGVSRPGRGYKVPDDEKAAARYSAMLSASPSPGEDVVERIRRAIADPQMFAGERGYPETLEHYQARAVIKALEG